EHVNRAEVQLTVWLVIADLLLFIVAPAAQAAGLHAGAAVQQAHAQTGHARIQAYNIGQKLYAVIVRIADSQLAEIGLPHALHLAAGQLHTSVAVAERKPGNARSNLHRNQRFAGRKRARTNLPEIIGAPAPQLAICAQGADMLTAGSNGLYPGKALRAEERRGGHHR